MTIQPLSTTKHVTQFFEHIKPRVILPDFNEKPIVNKVLENGDRFIKSIKDGIETTAITKQNGTHYCGTARNGKVSELSERMPNGNTYILS